MEKPRSGQEKTGQAISPNRLILSSFIKYPHGTSSRRGFLRMPILGAMLVAGLLVAPRRPTVPMVCSCVASGPSPKPIIRTSSTIESDGHGKMFGVGLSGGEFTPSKLPGVLGTDYIYPVDQRTFQYFHRHRMTLLRVPFLWERLQPDPFSQLSPRDVAGLRAVLDTAHTNGQEVILDMHNFGQYYGKPLAREDAPRYSDFWTRLDRALGSHPALFGYELMNEPHDLPGGQATWSALVQSAINAVRETNTNSWVLVPGYQWQNAHHWPENNRDFDVNDPTKRLLYAAHQYFDKNESGLYAGSYVAEEAYPCIGFDRIQPFLAWLSDRNAGGILTEYGVPGNDPRWLIVLGRFLATLDCDPRIKGGTYWPAGPWWGANPLSVEPINGRSRPQMAVLSEYSTPP